MLLPYNKLVIRSSAPLLPKEWQVLCTRVTHAWSEGGKAALECVEDVDLHRYAHVADDAAARVFRACSSAHRVNMYQCRKVSQGAIDALAESCMELKELNITGNPHITVQMLDNVVRRCTKLESLQLAGCDRIPENTLTGKYKRFCDIFDEEEEGPWTA